MYGGDNFKFYMLYLIDVFNERNVRFFILSYISYNIFVFYIIM